MSFILDALKKSESDRQRQSGPALFEVKVAPPRRGLPLWAIALGVLLAVNAVIVAWMMLRHPRAEAAVTVTPPPLVAAQPAPASPGPPAQGQQLVVAPPAGGAPQAAPVAVPASAPYPTQPPAGAAGDEPDAEDLAPAQEPPPFKANHVQRGTVEGVPLYQDASATPGTHIPPLRLDLHVYAERPQDRFVMINMRKLREGEVTPEGVRVESITTDGAVLSYNGSRFLLTRD